MTDQQTSIRPIKCPHCGQAGSVAWTVPNPSSWQDKPVTNLVKVSSGFHWEVGRRLPDQVLILCDVCDAVQAVSSN
jgi:hypothetical protein